MNTCRLERRRCHTWSWPCWCRNRCRRAAVQQHAAFAIPFHPRDLGAAEPAAAIDADALRAKAHRRLHRPLHRPAERDAAFELLGDAVGDQLGVDLGLPDLDDVEADLALRDLRQIGAQLVDIGALLADDDAGAGRMQRDARLARRARSIRIFATACACVSRPSRNFRSFPDRRAAGCWNPCRANQRESQVRLIPRRSPIGLTF